MFEITTVDERMYATIDKDIDNKIEDVTQILRVLDFF